MSVFKLSIQSIARKLNFLTAIGIFIILLGCGSSYEHDYLDENGYKDGTYCAEIEYYNPKTGTRSTYKLNVEVEDNEVTVIYWGNGGWLDSDHFYPEELDSDGYCSFTTDRGYEYEVRILGEECDFTDQVSFENTITNDLKAITCSRCGFEKNDYEDYCDDC